jgi:hypothetical protein
VPTPNVSVVDFVARMNRAVTADEINASFREAAKGPLEGILGVSEEPLVSIDFTGSPLSSIVDTELTQVIGERMAKVIIRLGELPVAYRNTTTLLHEFPGLTAAERDRICDAWTQPARADGRPITSVRVYEVVESVRPDGPAPRRRLAYECGSGS